MQTSVTVKATIENAATEGCYIGWIIIYCSSGEGGAISSKISKSRNEIERETRELLRVALKILALTHDEVRVENAIDGVPSKYYSKRSQ
jgi:hypothetical protein